VSFVERLSPDVDPLTVIAACVRPDAENATAPGGADCMYWARPSDRFAVAGIGAATTLVATGTDRFREIEREWADLIDGAIIDDDAGASAIGTGPLLMGGFAFDPDGPRSARWTGFPAARFSLPRFTITEAADTRWLTTTVVVAADGVPDIPLPDLQASRARIVGFGDGSARRRSSVPPKNESGIEYTDLCKPALWLAAVGSAVDAIRGGTFEKVVLARGVRAAASDPFDIGAAIRHLRVVHPDSFIFACCRGERVFMGASPERLVRLDGREVLASSLAGSARRGADAEEDASLAAQLLDSPKDADEHAVVVRVLRDTLAELCDDVSAAPMPSLLTLPHMHHLHTIVRARLRPGHSLLELIGRLHPTPAVGGTPRAAALAFIRAHEHLDRGWYAAPVGWLQRDRGEFAVALRSALVRGSEATLFAGCGIVRDSDPELEYAESVLKLRPMAVALAAAQGAQEPSEAVVDTGRA
jgi:isochorismate synthase